MKSSLAQGSRLLSFVFAKAQAGSYLVYTAAHPGKTPAELAAYLSTAPGSPEVSPRLMAGVMREFGIPLPRKEESPAPVAAEKSGAEEATEKAKP